MNLLLCSRGGSFERRLLTAATAAAATLPNYQCTVEEKLVIHQAVVSKEKEMVRTNQHEDLIWS